MSRWVAASLAGAGGDVAARRPGAVSGIVNGAKTTSAKPARPEREAPLPNSTTKFELPCGRSRCSATALLHLEPLVGEDELFHGDVAALGVERPAAVLDDARAQQLPGLHDLAVVLVLKPDGDRAQRVLVAVSDVVEPAVEVE